MRKKFSIQALIWLLFLSGVISAQVIKQTPTPKPTPKPSATPSPKPTPPVTPTPSPTPTPTPPPIQSLADMQAKLSGIVSRAVTRRGSIGVKIASLDSGKVVFENNAEKYFMPASNMKSYTVAAAMERLSPDFKFVTSVYAAMAPDANGVIKGDLTIYGRGDLSMSMAFTQPNATAASIFPDSEYLKVIEPLANKIAASGIKKIEGSLIGDDSYFSGDAIPGSWEWDDLQWFYGAEVSALPVLDNAIDLFVRPGEMGAPCSYQILPNTSQFVVRNTCLTSPKGMKRELKIVKKLDQNILEISGYMPADDKPFRGYVTITRPGKLFIEMLRRSLQQKGITIKGAARVIEPIDKAKLAAAAMLAPIEIARLESPPLSLIAAKTMKPSQNMFTETILRALGEQLGDKSDPKLTSADRGIGVVSAFLQSIGIPSDAVIQWDGSGLSRHNLVTPASNIQLYTYMAKGRHAQAWRDSLTIGGIDGTLKTRFLGTAAYNNVRGKTGTIDQVSALSGYINTAAGERVVFSIIINGVNSGRLRNDTIDEIILAIANFNGRIN